MPARSSRPSLAGLVALAALTACKSSPPGADPAKVTRLASQMARNVPTPAAVRDCRPEELRGGVHLTFRSLQRLAALPLTDKPEDAAWVNPTALESPAVTRVLDAQDRVAAAELLHASSWVAYKVDLVNAPMALGVKELKVGTLHTRIIRYEPSGLPSCLLVFNVQNDQAVSDKAIEVSDQAVIDPKVAALLRDDLVAQYVKLAPR